MLDYGYRLKDGSGALDAQELQRALEDLDLPSGDVEVSELFSKLDVNKAQIFCEDLAF